MDSETEPAVQAGTAVERGVAALLALQDPGGSFPLLQRDAKTMWRHCHTLFSTVTVVLAAGSLLPRESVSRAVNFVLRCRRSDGLWEFDPAYGIPPDADDTACAIAALARYADGYVGARDAELLRSFWRADGGPFQTWRGSGMWAQRDRDDPVVNCNIMLALARVGAPPTPEERSAVHRLVQQSAGGCRYYCSLTTIAYAAQRAGLPLHALPAGLVARPRSQSGVLPSAQWLSAAGRWDAQLIAHVIGAQSPDGSWPTEPWFTGAGNPVPVWGSRAVSTALCIEALQAALAAGTA